MCCETKALTMCKINAGFMGRAVIPSRDFRARTEGELGWGGKNKDEDKVMLEDRKNCVTRYFTLELY